MDEWSVANENYKNSSCSIFYLDYNVHEKFNLVRHVTQLRSISVHNYKHLRNFIITQDETMHENKYVIYILENFSLFIIQF